MALFAGTKKAKKRAKAYQATQAQLGGAGIEAVAAETGRTGAAEEARSRIYNLLGAPGTYDAPGKGGTATTAPSSIFSTTNPWAQVSDVAKGAVQGKGSLSKAGLDKPREGILDPDAYAETVAGTAGFRIQSLQVAESEQLLREEGPLYDRLKNSIHGQIFETNAEGLRDDLRRIKNNAAKGGSARRGALREAAELNAQENRNRSVADALWKSNLGLFNSIRANADRVAAGTGRFLDNLPEIRDSYLASMGSLGKAMAEISLPRASQAARAGYLDTEETMQKKGFWTGLTEGLIMAVVAGAASYVGGPAAGAAFNQATATKAPGTAGSNIAPGSDAGQEAEKERERQGGIFSGGGFLGSAGRGAASGASSYLSGSA